LALQVSQFRQFTVWKFQEFSQLGINVCAIGGWRRFLSSQELRNVGLRNFSGASKIALFKAKFFQPMFNHQRNIHLSFSALFN